jgi:tetratricopeptide (TPR) repeat protein
VGTGDSGSRRGFAVAIGGAVTDIRSAVEHHQAGRLAEAEAIYRQILAQNPNDFDALHLLGVIAQESGQSDAAVELIEQAIKIKPGFAPAHTNLGNALKSAGRLDEAIKSYAKAVELNPSLAQAHFNLGKAYADAGEFEAAAASYRRAIEINPNYIEAHGNLGAALASMNDLPGAIAAYRRPIEMRPDSVEAWAGLGFALLCVGEVDQAEAACRKAIQLNPDFAEGHWNLAQVLLTRGNFDEGLKEYEWRTRLKTAPAPPPFKQPHWRGEDLLGKTIFLYAEQGFGDTIWFARYLPMVAARGAKVILGCPPILHGVLRSLPGVNLLKPTDPTPNFDYQSSLFSLPFIFGTRLDSIPAEIPYLNTDPTQVEKWKPTLARAGNKLKVGLAWAGRPWPVGRSIPPRMLEPLTNPNVQFFRLQFGAKTPSPDLDLIDETSSMTEFGDTAAFIEQLDLVIGVDTATVQLAGAMGKPVWVLLKRIPDWRWLLDRPDSPWYPTARLYRQKQFDDWTDPIRRAADDLAKLTEERNR